MSSTAVSRTQTRVNNNTNDLATNKSKKRRRTMISQSYMDSPLITTTGKTMWSSIVSVAASDHGHSTSNIYQSKLVTPSPTSVHAAVTAADDDTHTSDDADDEMPTPRRRNAHSQRWRLEFLPTEKSDISRNNHNNDNNNNNIPSHHRRVNKNTYRDDHLRRQLIAKQLFPASTTTSPKTVSNTPGSNRNKIPSSRKVSNSQQQQQMKGGTIMPWDSLASLASGSIMKTQSPNKMVTHIFKQSTNGEPAKSPGRTTTSLSAKTTTTRDKGFTELDVDSVTSPRRIPAELVSVLVPKGLKSTKRLPKSIQEVLKQDDARRKRDIPPRTRLPRECKSKNDLDICYVEDSDDGEIDDAYWYALMKRKHRMQQNESVLRPGRIASNVRPNEISPRHPKVDQNRKSNDKKKSERQIVPVTVFEPKPRQGTKNEMEQFKAPLLDVAPFQSSAKQLTSNNEKQKSRIVTPPKLLPKRKRDQSPKHRLIREVSSLKIDNKRPLSHTSLRNQTRVVTRRATRPPSPPAKPPPRAKVSTRGNSQPKSPNGLARSNSKDSTSLTTKEISSSVTGRKPEIENVAYLENENERTTSVPRSSSADKQTPLKKITPPPPPIQNDLRSTSVTMQQQQQQQQPVPVFKAPPQTPTLLEIVPKEKPIKERKASKVRFAPLPSTTTTFSVKIRVKTSTSPSKRTGRKTQEISPSGLSESAVQSIAQQITQACLAQAPSVHSTSSNLELDEEHDTSASREEEEEDDDDDDDESEFDTGSTSEVEIETEPEPESKIKGALAKPQQQQQRQVQPPQQHDNVHDNVQDTTMGDEMVLEHDHDARSVASEITMDVALIRGQQNPPTSVKRMHRDRGSSKVDLSTPNLATLSKPSTLRTGEVDASAEERRESPTRQAQAIITNSTPTKPKPIRTSPIRHLVCTDSLVAGEDMTSSPRKAAIPDSREIVSPPPRKKSRRILTCNDSLAGCSLASINSVNHLAMPPQPKLPSEVAITRQSSSFLTKKHPVLETQASSSTHKSQRPQNRSNVRLQDSANHDNKRKNPVFHVSNNNDETVVTDGSVDSHHKSQQQQADNGKCGKCSGCRRGTPCLTSSNRTGTSTIQKGTGYGNKGYMKSGRQHHTHVESLGRPVLLQVSGKMAPTEQPRAIVAEESHVQLPPPKQGNGHQGSNSYNDGNVDNDDDDDANMSFFSETASVTSSVLRKRQSRAVRLWRRRWSEERRLRRRKDNNGTMIGGGGGSISSVSASVALSATTAEKAGGRKSRAKKGKKKISTRNPLHNLELPAPTDGSVASFMEGRRSLRALMRYDEADQDWL